MRTSLFLSALFAATLVGGVASAEKPKDMREKGDMVDKTYKQVSSRTHMNRNGVETHRVNPGAQKDVRPSPGESRWNCGEDCKTRRTPPTRASSETSSRASRTQGSSKVNERAEQRWNCAPTDDSCRGVRSSVTTKRGDKGDSAGKSAAERAKNDRLGSQGTTVSDRMKADKSKGSDHELNAAQKRLAEKLHAMLVAKACEKVGADCASK